MRAAAAPLIALLADSKQFVMWDRLYINPASGGLMTFESGDVSPAPPPTDPLIVRSAFRSSIGLEVDTLDISLLCNSGTLLNGIPATRFAIEGGLDGAHIQLDRVYSDFPGNGEIGVMTMFRGNVGDVEIDSTEIRMSVNSFVELLNVQMPRNLFMAPCGRTLYDSGCTLSRAVFEVDSTVAAGSTYSTINCALAQAAGYFDQGTLTFLTGVHAGESRTIRTYTPGVFNVSFPFSSALALPSIGDAFQAFPGCDKTQATCDTKFSNLQHFRGFPYVPVPEVSY